MSYKIIEFENSADANAKARAHIKTAMEQEPGSQVTLIVDTYRNGHILQKQICFPSTQGEDLATAGLELFTGSDLLALLAEKADLLWSASDQKRALSEAVQRRLYRDQEFGEANKLMPGTIIAITDAVSRFNWVELEDISIYNSLNVGSLTPTAKKLLAFALNVQKDLNAAENFTPARMLKLLRSNLDSIKLSGTAKEFGNVIQLDSQLPQDFNELILDLLGPKKYVVFEKDRQATESQIVEAEVLSFPDVFTEVRHATSKIVKFLLQSENSREIAVLYSDPQDYASSLMSALDDAGIEWFGPAKEQVANARISILVKDILDYAARPQDFYLDRKTIMRAIRSRILINPPTLPEEFSWYKAERFIKSKGFFNNSESWLPELIQIAGGIEELLVELSEAKKYPDELDPIQSAEDKLDDAYSALALQKVIEALTEFKAAVNNQKSRISELDSAKRLTDLISFLTGAGNATNMPALDAKALAIILETLGLGFGDQGEDKQNHARALLTKVTEALQNKGKYKTGNSGIFVGALNQHPALKFDYLVVLGCSEGAMPKRIQEDALIPDALKIGLPDGLRPCLPDTNFAIKEAQSSISSVMRGAKSISLSFARDGLVGTGSGKVSPLVKSITSSPVVDIQSFEQFIDEQPNAVLRSDLSRKANIFDRVKSAEGVPLVAELQSAIALHSSEFGMYFGNIGPGTNAFDLEQKVLSASAVETYLKCPHKFLVTYGLGFRFEDDVDEIENYRANDFGTMAHSAWELLFSECSQKGMVPKEGERFSEKAKSRFREIFKEQVQAAKNKGQAGWEPLFNERANQFLENVDTYFELEYEHRSKTPRVVDSTSLELRAEFTLRPHLAEYSFDRDGLMYLSIAVPSDHGSVTMNFKGRMDRLDLSNSGIAAGILDFKTGKSSTIRGSEDEHIQDLLYGHAMRNSAEYPTIDLVTFHYLTMNTKEESALISLRKLPTEIFANVDDGGLGNDEIAEAIILHNQELDKLLVAKLSLLADAIASGTFAPNSESKSAQFCEVCKIIGKSRSRKIAGFAQRQERAKA
jgi:hypothetical protein